MAFFVIVTIAALIALTLGVARLYSHLAVQERQVVGAWDQLERLLVQRNGHLQKLYAEAQPRESALNALHEVLRKQEIARRQGDLATVAATEREIRSAWDAVSFQHIDIKEEKMDYTARRVAALDQAIRDTLVRYNEALAQYERTCRSPIYAPLALVGGMGRYAALQPPGTDSKT